MNAIEFNQVRKSFKSGLKRSTVLFDISFDVLRKEIFGFLGPNGAGKSTTIKILMNFIRMDSGTIRVNGLDTSREPFQHHIGFLPETPCFYENLTGRETLRFAGNACAMQHDNIAERSQELLERMNLAHAGDNKVRTYSKGMKQRLGLAAALIHDPAIYILDEPMSGLDPMGRRLVTDVILELKEKGSTVFFSSHILSDIERLCDRVGVLNKGHLLYCGDVDSAVAGSSGMEDAFIDMIRKDEEAARA